MYKTGSTSVSMEFDSGVFKHKISIYNEKLNYPNKISSELKSKIELSIAVIIEHLINNEVKQNGTNSTNNGRISI